MMKKVRILLVYLLLLPLIVLVILLSASIPLSVNRYTVSCAVEAPVRIVHLTDLHNRSFGKNNQNLISKIEDQKPDMIFMTGDMLNSEEENINVILNVISELSDIAPVYYGYGNHENAWESIWHKDLQIILETEGAIVLDQDYIDLNVNGAEIRIGGYEGYYRRPHMTYQDQERQDKANRFFDDFENTDRLKLLLNHIPTMWLDWECLDEAPVDIVFCGHYHGGIWKIPFLNCGVYAPYVGWFPKYTKGVYEGEKTTCVLSAGLGDEYEYIIPRLNNPPEIVVVDLIPDA